jgi:hypothetical protein
VLGVARQLQHAAGRAFDGAADAAQRCQGAARTGRRRASGASGCCRRFDSSGMKMPAGCPRLPSPARMALDQVTCQPRAHRRSQAAQPARPAPSTTARRSGAGPRAGAACGWRNARLAVGLEHEALHLQRRHLFGVRP